jgi:uncharacterized protein
MQLSFDPDKNERNIQELGLAFTLASELDWATALIDEDTRLDYGGLRYKVLGCIEERLCALIFTPRADMVHVVSLRKANAREVKHYGKTTQP